MKGDSEVPLGLCEVFAHLSSTVGGIGVELPATADQPATRLRSPESPQELSFDLRLPEGAQLRPSEKGSGAEVVSADGDAITEVTPPTASDAQCAVVPVTMEVKGSRSKEDRLRRDSDDLTGEPLLRPVNHPSEATTESQPKNHQSPHLESLAGPVYDPHDINTKTLCRRIPITSPWKRFEVP